MAINMQQAMTPLTHFLEKKDQHRFRELKAGLEMENGKIPQFNWCVLFIMRHS